MNHSKSLYSAQTLTAMAVFAALLCVSAYISIPTPLPGSPHITMQNFIVLLTALLFPAGQSFLIILIWMLLGILGLPVFIGGAAGIGYLLSPWGGYTVSFLLTGLILPLIRGRRCQRLRCTITALTGVIIIDLSGMVWLMNLGGFDLQTAFLAGFVSFLPLDAVKAVAAAQIIPYFRRFMQA